MQIASMSCPAQNWYLGTRTEGRCHFRLNLMHFITFRKVNFGTSHQCQRFCGTEHHSVSQSIEFVDAKPIHFSLGE